MRTSKDNVSASVLKADGKLCCTPQEVSGMFARHFSSTFLQSDSTPPVFNIEESFDGLAYESITEDEVLLSVRRLKSKLSTGCDGIPNFIIKGCAEYLVPALTHVYNLSLRRAEFPSRWKMSVVVPIFKSGDPCDVNNFRPVSLLCGFSKVFEMVIYERLYFYFKRKISPLQHGFLKGRSIETNMSVFLGYTGPLVANRGQVDTIYFDMSKAFDRVSHNILLSKLKKYGLCPTYCSWFSSYLGNRQNQVSFSDCLSGPFLSLSGVPQGSNLGPLLFLVFINDLPSQVLHSKALLYAGDLKLFRRVENVQDCLLLQNDVCSIEQWCITNRLQLNLKKTSVMSISRKHESIVFSYNLSGGHIKRVSLVRDLGVQVDSRLFFHQHVSQIVNQGLRCLGAVSRITRKFRSPHCVLSLYCSLVRPRLEFASVIWNSVSLGYSNVIEEVQWKFIRIVYDRHIGRRRFYSYSSVLADIGLQSLHDRRLAHDMNFLRKVVHGTLDCDELLSSLCFRVPSGKACKCIHTFYTDIHSKCPMTRLQDTYNSMFLQDDIFT